MRQHFLVAILLAGWAATAAAWNDATVQFEIMRNAARQVVRLDLYAAMPDSTSVWVHSFEDFGPSHDPDGHRVIGQVTNTWTVGYLRRHAPDGCKGDDDAFEARTIEVIDLTRKNR